MAISTTQQYRVLKIAHSGHELSEIGRVEMSMFTSSSSIIVYIVCICCMFVCESQPARRRRRAVVAGARVRLVDQLNTPFIVVVSHDRRVLTAAVVSVV